MRYVTSFETFATVLHSPQLVKLLYALLNASNAEFLPRYTTCLRVYNAELNCILSVSSVMFNL